MKRAYIAAALIIILVLGGISAWYFTRPPPLPDDWMFVVNGVIITQSDVLTQYNALSPEQKQTITLNDVARSVFENVLLLQEARRLNLVLTQDEYDAGYAAYLKANNLTEEQLRRNLVALNQDYSTFEATLGNELLIQKLLNQQVPLTAINIPEADIVKAYEESQYKKDGVPLELVRYDITSTLQKPYLEQARVAYIGALRRQATIKVNGVD